MPIANYTTAVPESKSIAEVTGMLVTAGARALMFDYDASGQAEAVSFRINKGQMQLGFRLPCDWRGTLKVIHADRKIQPRFKTAEQSRRIAWRVIRDWLRAQLALVEIGCASVDQVMLPYAITDTGETLYQRITSTQYRMLALPQPA